MLIKEKKKILCLAAGIILLVGIITYVALRMQAQSRFASGTVINEIDVSGMKIEQLKERMEDYSLDVVERTKSGEKLTETIKGKDFGVRVGKNQKSAQKILDEQSVWDYITKAGKKHTIAGWLEYDEAKLEKAVKALSCFREDFVQKPKNAKISEYSDTGYSIIAENQGNAVIEEKVIDAVFKAVHGMDLKVNLEKQDCYQKPEITSESQTLKNLLKKMNRYTSAKITYQFDEKQEIVDGDVISTWISVNSKNKVVFDTEKVAEYIAGLRKKYDTIFSSRRFKTSYGNTVIVNGGDYGWWMNYKKEEQELLKLVKKGKNVQRKPEYYQEAQSYGKHDYGNSYIEINLTTQHMFLYVDGKRILESDCVTGNASRGFDTPVGTYGITYTQKDATLTGENYSTPVKYWMPFNRNIGLHDASWRSRFGGTVYKYNGSHGCVNLPPKTAQKLFGYVKTGMPVICYQSGVTKEKAVKAEKKQKK